MESNRPKGIIGSKSALMLALNHMDALHKSKDEVERGIKITNEPQPIPFVLKAPSPLPTISEFHNIIRDGQLRGKTKLKKDHKPNTGFKLGSYTYKSKRK